MWQFPYAPAVPKTERASPTTTAQTVGIRFEANKQKNRREKKHAEKQICVQFEHRIQQMLPMSRRLRFTHDNRTRACNAAPHASKHLIFARIFFFLLRRFGGAKRDKNHHCRCSHGCFARTLIFAGENINANRSISFGFNFECSIRSHGNCELESASQCRSQRG